MSQNTIQQQEVITVLGPVSPSELGITQTHEHIILDAYDHYGSYSLVIDDEEVVRNVTKRMLARIGYTPLLAEDGPSGLELYDKHRDEIVCVLLDMTMPRMSGEQTLGHLKQRNPDIRVLLMSGYSEQEAGTRFNGKGVAAFMQKPYTPQDLQEKLSEVLEG